jgi:hypothetical protein
MSQVEEKDSVIDSNHPRKKFTFVGSLEALIKILVPLGITLGGIMYFVEGAPSYARYIWYIANGYGEETGWVYYEISKTFEPTSDGRFVLLDQKIGPVIEDLRTGQVLFALDNVNIRKKPINMKKGERVGYILLRTCVEVTSSERIKRTEFANSDVLSGGWIQVSKRRPC